MGGQPIVRPGAGAAGQSAVGVSTSDGAAEPAIRLSSCRACPGATAQSSLSLSAPVVAFRRRAAAQSAIRQILSLAFVTVPPRPNPFLERKLRPSPAPAPQKTSWFQRARDWTAFVVSLTSLVTALIALRNTLTGPRPFLAQLAGDAITILRSDQFLLGAAGNAGILLRDENGQPGDFPLLIVQPALANRAPPPNGIGVRAIEGDLVFSRQGRILFSSPYVWYRTTTSSIGQDGAGKADRLVFDSAAQTAPFDLPGGGTWSREVLLIPRQSWEAVSWKNFDEQVTRNCPQPMLCQGEFTLRVRFDNGVQLTEPCSFPIDEHMLAHLKGVERRYFTSPGCLAPATR